MSEEKQNTSANEEHEIDLLGIFREIWDNRKFIIKITLAFMALGVLVALFSAKEYTASSIMVPQTTDKKTGSIGGLAAMAGINLGDVGGGEVLPPQIYPVILGSIPFQKELINTPFDFEKIDHKITLLQYYTDPEYVTFNLLSVVKKYTIGLPWLLLKSGKKEEMPSDIVDTNIETLTKQEKKCIDIMKNEINLLLSTKDGYMTLSVNMPEPILAAQVAGKTQTLLQQYITEFKIAKVQSDLEFVEERFNEVKKEFEQIQSERAAFRDANKNLISARAQTEQEKLDTRYNLTYAIYSELAKQLEQAKIKVKETTPILTIINPVTVPTQRSKPRRGMICVLFTFLGIVAGIGTVTALPFIRRVVDSGVEEGS